VRANEPKGKKREKVRKKKKKKEKKKRKKKKEKRTKEGNVWGLSLRLRQPVLLVVSLGPHLGLELLIGGVHLGRDTLPRLFEPVHRNGLEAADHGDDIVEVLDLEELLGDGDKLLHHGNPPPWVLTRADLGGHPKADLVKAFNKSLEVLRHAGGKGVGLLAPDVEDKLVGGNGLQEVHGDQGEVVGKVFRVNLVKVDALHANIFNGGDRVCCLPFVLLLLGKGCRMGGAKINIQDTGSNSQEHKHVSCRCW